jgi:heavy metal translocating P-type ATPase
VARYGFDAERAADGIWLAVLLLIGLPLAARTAYDLIRGRFQADVIAALAIAGAAAMHEYLAGVVIVLMQSTGEALERVAFSRASDALAMLESRAPRTAHRLERGALVDLSPAAVAAGDRLVIKPGEMVPVDARVLVGESTVDQSALTGEPVVVDVRPGRDLLSGSVNMQGALEVEALRPAAESQYERIVTLVRAAQADRPPIQRLADRAATVFTPLTLAMCAVGWVVTGDARTALSVLVVATPCPLILAVPVAVFAGINRAAGYDAIVKHGVAIEQVGRARSVVFDKTGTLTVGAPEVVGLLTAGGFDADHLLRLAAAVEQLSSHQLGRALAEYGAARGGPLPMPVDFTETAGRGVHGRVDGRLVEVGALSFAAPAVRPRAEALISSAAEDGSIPALVLVDGEPAGVVLFSDRLRPGVARMVSDLRTLGVERIVMLTGDREAMARVIAAQAGIDDVRADLLPPDKVTAVKELEEQAGPVVMVGDGTNDAPALATATVGVAMGAHGAGISAEAAGIVLLKDDVTSLPHLMRVSRRMRRVALQCAGIGIGLSTVLMVVAVFGFIQPTLGAVLQEVIDVTVVLNALRARAS